MAGKGEAMSRENGGIRREADLGRNRRNRQKASGEGKGKGKEERQGKIWKVRNRRGISREATRKERAGNHGKMSLGKQREDTGERSLRYFLSPFLKLTDIARDE
jgi:hypothetical protein